ncbi:MAG TPA: DUF4446 family protein [Patescibacteria group bacterium]|jgi:competence protein ComGC|nr:DUF4446 family protein [Patescibacteria group bacterium]
MVFNGGGFFSFVWVFIIVWLSVLSVVLFRMISHYNRLTNGITSHGLKEVLEVIVKNQKGLQKQTADIERSIKSLVSDGKLHIQKIGLVRFNPFSDTGGSQSFTLALLDGGDNGIVMTSLYARTGNRWYVKAIRAGKGEEYELSKEESRAIQEAESLNGKDV